MRSLSGCACRSARHALSSCAGKSGRRPVGGACRGALWPAAAAVALATVFAPSCGEAAGIDPSLIERRDAHIRREGPLVTSIEFVGNDTFGEGILLRYMNTCESTLLSPVHFDSRTLERDLDNLETFYAFQGFLDAEVRVEDTVLSPDSLRIGVLIGVREGPRWVVSEVTFEGNSALTAEELLDVVKVRPGTPLRSNRLAADRRLILDEYAARSYLDARVSQVVERDDAAKTAAVHYRIVEREPAVIGSIEVTGDDKTRQFVIEREFEFTVGEPFDFEKIGETQARLYRTGLFQSVWIEPAREDTGKGAKRLEVRVRERPSGRFDFTFGYAALDGIEVGAAIVNRNVQGQAIELGIEGTFSEYVRGTSVSVGDPWFTGRRVAANASGRYEWADERSYVAETVGAGFVLTKRFGDNLSLEGGYDLERTVVLEASEEVGEFGANYTSNVLSALTYDSRDDILNAKRGMLARVEVDFASSHLGGTNDFARYELEWRGYKKLTRGRVGALAFRLGWVKPQGDGADVPVNERYFAGGEGSVRGFDRNSLSPLDESGEPKGGRALVEARAEARFPVWKRLRAAVFVDAGQAFDDFTATKLTGLAVGAGTGLRYETRVGVIRFDAAIPISEKGSPKYYLGVGQAF